MQEFARLNFSAGSYRLLWELVSQDKSENSSTIRLQAVITVTNNYISWDRGNARIYDDSFGLSRTYYRGDNVVRDITRKIWHDANGKKTVYIDGSIDTTFMFNGTCGGNITLPDIPRNATCTSSPDLIVNGKNTKHDLYFNNPGNYWLRIEYVWSNTVQIGKNMGQGTHHTITFTQDELMKLYKRDNFILRTVTHSNGSYNSMIGYTDKEGKTTHQGVVRIYKNSSWKKGLFFVYKNKKWNLATVNIYKNKKWNGGK